MEAIGIVVITVVMACAVAGAIAALRDDEKGLGKEFLEGLRAIGHIFIPVAGIMASVPFLSAFIKTVVGPAFGVIGADPAMAATSVIAVDMGGYQLARSLASSHEGWIMAMLTGYMAGATIVFSIPVGLALLEKRDHKYLALGMMSGLLSIPVGILVGCVVMMLLGPSVRPMTGTTPHVLALSLPTVLLNLLPLVLFVVALAVGLRLKPDAMIRGFMVFGRLVFALIVLVLVASIVEHFTRSFYGKGIFTLLFGGWGFDPVIADPIQIENLLNARKPVTADEIMRALEVAGYIGLMLAGAFPMVYLIEHGLRGPMTKFGKKLGLEAAGAAGLLAAIANILAMFRLVKDMRPKDKVLVIAFAVCSAFLFGDHLAFTATWQPTLLLPVLLGKFSGGIFAFWLAYRLSVPKALELEKQEMEDHVRSLIPLIPALRDGEVKKVKPLTGGLTNRNYRLDIGDESYVMRIAGTGTELLGIDREREVACAHAAAGAGVGPEVIAHLPEHHATVVRFVKGHALTVEELRRPEILHRVAQTLRRCHEYPAPPDLGTFSPFEAVRAYHALALQRHVSLPAELAKALDLLTRIEKEVRTDEPPCLCHNDLLLANFIDNGSTLYVIDWEYGGLGDRFFDLGNFAVNQQLDESQERVLLEAYFGVVRPEDLRRLRLMRLASDMREAMWSFVQAGISNVEPPEYYLKRGREHLERFLTMATTL
ncbi:MAG TPA: ethanolamine utilization protein EutH [Gemmataceae bacterium]|nr:ethanolamine utilization protein EutH [Gemmataceae bacterium]